MGRVGGGGVGCVGGGRAEMARTAVVLFRLSRSGARLAAGPRGQDWAIPATPAGHSLLSATACPSQVVSSTAKTAQDSRAALIVAAIIQH